MKRDPEWRAVDFLAYVAVALLFAAWMGLVVASDRDGKLALTHVVQGWVGK